MKITCVIVTFNRLELLKQTLCTIEAQSRPVDETLIFNNASTDGTLEYLAGYGRKDNVTVINEQKNLGGAGGFKQGIKSAYESGADFIWVMDDDSAPTPTALEKLLEPLSSTLKDVEVGFLASQVRWNGQNTLCYMNTPLVDRDWPELISTPERLVKLHATSFVSALVSRRAVNAVGYPVAEFFIWFDDSEYTSRISALFDCYFVPGSIVNHMTAENLRPLDYSKMTRQNIWKYAYGVRNECAVRVYRSRRFRAVRGFVFALQQAWRSHVFSRSFFMTMKIFFASLKGLFFRFNRYIEYPADHRPVSTKSPEGQ